MTVFRVPSDRRGQTHRPIAPRARRLAAVEMHASLKGILGWERSFQQRIPLFNRIVEEDLIMKFDIKILLAAILIPVFSTHATAQSAYKDGKGPQRPAKGAATEIPRDVLNRLGAVFSKPRPQSAAVIGHYLVCTTIRVGIEPDDVVETCDPVLVWCPKPDDKCITIN